MKGAALLALILFLLPIMSAQTTNPDLQELNRMAARFAPTPLRVDTSNLNYGDHQALGKMIEAARVLNTIFMRQLWSENLATYEKVKADKTPLGQARAHYYWLQKGPWSDLDDHLAFLPGVPPRKPAGANFYPEDLTKQEFERWLPTLTADQQEAAKGFFTVIRRGPTRNLMVVPFSTEYAGDLQKAAGLLRDAAALTSNESLKRFLTTRAD